MTEVYLKGRLGKVVGSFFKFNCRTLKEVFTAIEANTGRFEQFLFSNRKRSFAIFVDGKEINCDGSFNINVREKEVLIIPILFGSFVATSAAIAAAVLGSSMVIGISSLAFIATFKIVQFVVGMVLMTAFSFGMSLLMSKIMGSGDDSDDASAAATSSYAFRGAENVTKQGVVVPVGYGRMIIGSRVASINSFNVDRTTFEEGMNGIFRTDTGSGSTNVLTSSDYPYKNTATSLLGMGVT